VPSRKEEKERLRSERREEEARLERAERARRLRNRVAVVVGVGMAGLVAVFALSSAGGGNAGPGMASASAGAYPYAVGQPGPGAQAPALKLPSTTGGTWDLAAQRGKTTLVYFQEGLGCQPCWDQIKDLEAQPQTLRALGIDQMVSVAGNPPDLMAQKVRDEGITTPVLADPDLSQSSVWQANRYGMMGASANGHSFVVVGPDGEIRWRADYGGSPNYTMYVPVANLVADLRAGLTGAPQDGPGA
jgi:peroxiredoxin Q/BCP